VLTPISIPEGEKVMIKFKNIIISREKASEGITFGADKENTYPLNNADKKVSEK
jgi:hypothetical protein